MYGQPRQKGPNVSSKPLLGLRSSTIACLKGSGILSDNLTGNRLDANVGGNYWKKTVQQMANLAPF